MPIIIANVTRASDWDGLNDYELRVNDEVVARFAHDRKRGLSACLRQAAEAFDEARKEGIAATKITEVKP